MGYAEAQVLPLRHLKLAEATLADAVDRLDSAYKSFSSTDGAKGTPEAVKMSAAEKAVNAICPDARAMTRDRVRAPSSGCSAGFIRSGTPWQLWRPCLAWSAQ